jgi:uncharacterized membrane protein (DUF2068 family)
VALFTLMDASTNWTENTMQDSSFESPQQGNPQQGTPQQGTPQQGAPRYDAPRYATQRSQRPLGVTILSILIGIEGLAEILIGILAIAALGAIGRSIGAHGHTAIANTFSVIGWILGILPLVVGIITLAVAVGLWMLKLWAFWTTVIISIIFLLRQVYEFIQPHDSYTLIILGTIIPAVVLLYLLIDPNVRRAFHLGGVGRERLV